MASAAANFIINIQQQVQGNAASALKQTENALNQSIAAFKELDVTAQKTGAAVSAAQGKLAEGQSKLSKLMASGDTKGFWKQAGVVDKLREAESKATAEHGKATAALAAGKNAVQEHANRLKQVADASKGSGAAAGEAAGETKGLGRAFDRLGGPLGDSLGDIFKLKDAFGKLGPGMGAMVGASVLVVAVVAAIAVALVAAAVAALKFGISTADAARDQGLLLEGMTGSKAAGDALGGTFTDLEKKFGASGDRLTQLSEQLQNSGVKGDDLKAALTAISESEAAVGTGGTEKLIQQLTSGAKSAKQLSNEIDKKLGGVAKARMLGLGNQAKVLEANLGETFGGLKIDGLLGGLAQLVGLTDANTASGKAMKLVFEKIFQPLVDAATSAIPYIELSLLSLINNLLRMYIASKPAVKNLEKMFAITPNQGIALALDAGKAAAYGIAISIGAVVAVFAILGAVVVECYEQFLGLINIFTATVEGLATVGNGINAAISWIGSGISSLVSTISDAASSAADAFTNLDWSSIGANIVKGLVAGLAGAGPLLVSAMGDLASSAEDALTSKLKIHSPSKVFAELGGYTGAGFAQGIDDSADDVGGAVNRMVNVPDKAPVPKGGKGGGAPVNVYVTIDATGGESTMDRLELGVTRLFEKLALEIGTDVNVEVGAAT